MENVGIQIVLLSVIIGGIIMIDFVVFHFKDISIILCLIGLYISVIEAGLSLGDIICKIIYGDDDNNE